MDVENAIREYLPNVIHMSLASRRQKLGSFLEFLPNPFV